MREVFREVVKFGIPDLKIAVESINPRERGCS